jgi:UDP-GlcNAc:undecaprenyl-phosphate/decaprenyl-phosphate GlcNAc-1-phosphate transferase
MRIIFYALAVGMSAIVTFALCVVILKLSHRYRLYPKIRERDMHKRPTPRLGGVAMFVGVVVAIAVSSQLPTFDIVFSEPVKVWGILASALLIVLIGVADDIWDLDWLAKLAGQILAGGVLAWSGIQIGTLPIFGGVVVLPPTFSLVITVLTVVLVMNAINFIDGLDGLVAGVAIIANGVFFVYSYVLAVNAGNTEYFNLASLVTAILIGACLGFLPLNWHPAKLFMGDAGALLVGLLMAVSAISVTGQVDPETWTGGRQLLPAFIPIILPFAVLVVPLLDFGLAVVRRLLAGKSPFAADRKHLHHRLVDMGHTQFQAVLIFYAWTTVFSLGCLSFMFLSWGHALALIIIGLVICTLVTVLPLGRRTRAERDAELEPTPADADHLQAEGAE